MESICREWEFCDYRIQIEHPSDSTHLLSPQVVLPNWKEVALSEADCHFRIEADAGGWRLFHNGEKKAGATTEQDSITQLKRLCHLDLATHAKDYVFVHAGVVEAKDGLLVLPGRTHSGKSTLVKALVDAGCSYFSDEYAVVDREGLVRSFPRPLCLRRTGGAEDFIPAEDLGWQSEGKPRRIKLIVSTRYDKEKEWNPRELTPGEAALALLENTVCARTAPEKALRTLSGALKGAVCLQGARGDSEVTARRILEHFP